MTSIVRPPDAAEGVLGAHAAPSATAGWRAVIMNALSLLAIAGMLWINALDVRQGWVRGIYGLMSLWLVVSFLEQRFRRWKQRELDSGAAAAAPRRASLRSSITFTLAILTLLLALEAAARALPPLTNSSLLYPGERFVWRDRYGPRNSLGMNDVEPAPVTQRPRILVLGDSYVEGAGVSRHERFCSRLQQALQQSYPEAQVIAAGVSGWNTRQEAQFLERYGTALAPDVVLVAYVLNDAEGTDQHAFRTTQWEQWLQTRLKSYLCYRVLRWRRGTDAEYWKTIRNQHQPGSSTWQDVDQSLTRIANWCRDRDVACQLAVLPIFTLLADQGREVSEQVVARSAALGMRSYHTLDDFNGRWAEFAVSPYDAHPNAAAHHRLAHRMARELEPDLAPRFSN